jgi:hypothetical protein
MIANARKMVISLEGVHANRIAIDHRQAIHTTAAGTIHYE